MDCSIPSYLLMTSDCSNRDPQRHCMCQSYPCSALWTEQPFRQHVQNSMSPPYPATCPAARCGLSSAYIYIYILSEKDNRFILISQSASFFFNVNPLFFSCGTQTEFVDICSFVKEKIEVDARHFLRSLVSLAFAPVILFHFVCCNT